MVVIRCTKRLLRRIGPLVSDADRSTTRLGDWYANLIDVGHPACGDSDSRPRWRVTKGHGAKTVRCGSRIEA